ncbi:MAG: ABC transporter substrate-binding protein [Acidobacteria bacterium]|nr:ABC transporter substrate-binding protein [Acidobacteriota bacterium]
MRRVAERVGLGIALIAIASAVLLFSDWSQRRTSRRLPRVALLQFSNFPAIDESVNGVLDGLRRKGFEENRSISLQRFNAHNDLPTLNSIARAIVDARFDLAVTLSTPALQAMAAANREGRILHVFGAVTDPFASGVGLRRENPLDHPRHITGIGSFQPVRETFQLSKKLYPGLRYAGMAWNPTEACSQACVKVARDTARALGMELLEAQVESSGAVLEAANSLVARGAEALFLGCDNTVEAARESALKAAAQGHIPVITCEASGVERGALLGLGADYYELGKVLGELAGDVLGGRDPALIAVADVVPKKLGLNLPALANLRDPWRVPPDLLASATIGIDEKGGHWDHSVQAARPAVETAARPAKRWKIHLIELVNAPAIEESRNGVLTGLREAGLVEGRDYEIRLLNAQGDMATLSTLVDAAVTGQADMVYTITTPALQAAMNKLRDRPVLFTLALDPLLVGDKGTHTAHRPNVAGIYDRSPFEGMMRVIRECMPGARSIGTLFTPAEANSVNFRDEMEKAAKEAGLQVVAVATASPGEVPDAATALTQRGIDAICQINDNLHGAAFPAIVAAARRAGLPVFGFSTKQAGEGAALVLSNDHFDGGRESALIAAQIIRGANPAQFPYRGITKTKLIVNPRAARAAKLRIPQAVLRRAQIVD